MSQAPPPPPAPFGPPQPLRQPKEGQCAQCADVGLVWREREVPCPVCGGSGQASQPCGTCGGDGWVPEETSGAPSISLLWGSLVGLCLTLVQMRGSGPPPQKPCGTCGGSGRVTGRCGRCGGSGRTKERVLEPCSGCARGRQARQEEESSRLPAFRARR